MILTHEQWLREKVNGEKKFVVQSLHITDNKYEITTLTSKERSFADCDAIRHFLIEEMIYTRLRVAMIVSPKLWEDQGIFQSGHGPMISVPREEGMRPHLACCWMWGWPKDIKDFLNEAT